ncbi:MAG: hypothetical protein WC138_11930, partial [Methanoculleus sp.]
GVAHSCMDTAGGVQALPAPGFSRGSLGAVDPCSPHPARASRSSSAHQGRGQCGAIPGGPVECGNPARRERSLEQSLAEEVFPVSVLS